ncbi:uncharacterized protein LOC129773822 [Toxorhynchites rutilus septentrionalis]|uniref:uncharacterized protein LOC129773822 n=1 Tax=Toxorhynchites rutilus septentrionalis TaxID=329112 RepID=UPI00247AB454|nr:uncharacterized protein LOC129773822 [Toxorhynchites rutilus septentrionalis]
MSNPGKYVLAPVYESDNSYGSADDEVYSPGKYVRATNPNESSVGCIYDSQDDPYAAVVDPEMENRELREKVLELEKSIAELGQNISRTSKLLLPCRMYAIRSNDPSCFIYPLVMNFKEFCYEVFIKNIDVYLRSLTDTSAEHDMFSSMQQKEGESAVNFYARLIEKVWLCGYSAADQDRFVRTQFLKGLRNRELAKAARTYNYDTTFVVQSATRDEALHHSENQHQSWRWNQIGGGTRMALQRHQRCSRCNRAAHGNQQCPAIDKNCNSCGRRGHFSATCRQKRVNTVQDRRLESGSPGEFNSSQQITTLSLEDVLVDCTVGSSKAIKFLIDSGADTNVIGGNDWHSLKEQLQARTVILDPLKLAGNRGLRGFAAERPMVVECAFRAKIQAIGCQTPAIIADFLVVEQGRCSLLGRSPASDMGLLKVGADVFRCGRVEQDQVFPKMPGVKIKFCVDSSVPPEKNAYYNVPAAYREAAKLRLKQMEERGIIERVNSAPEWISGMSAVPKGKDDFRLVVNMRAPNKAIKRQYFRLPLLEEMKVRLHGAKYFSKLDLSNAYYHLELNQESRDLTTFLAEDGMYRFTRLMFGVNCAPEIFQREMCRILEEVKNKIVYIDDILLFAETLQELRKTVAHVLRILRTNNLTLNTSKCEFDKTRIKFLGHELDETGFNIEESKIKDIRKFRHPSTTSELRSFLGLASFQNGLAESFMKVVNRAMSTAVLNETSYAEELQNAIHAYNAGDHSVIKISPEEVMMGRRIKRGLPLLEHGKSDFDDRLLDAEDREVKLKSKRHDDLRRGAKSSTVKPRDTVIIERHTKGKGDSRFHPKRFTVVREKNGSLLLADEEGHTVKRHLSQTKKVQIWRDNSRTNIKKPGNAETSERPARDTKAPSYLSDYIHSMENQSL